MFTDKRLVSIFLCVLLVGTLACFVSPVFADIRYFGYGYAGDETSDTGVSIEDIIYFVNYTAPRTGLIRRLFFEVYPNGYTSDSVAGIYNSTGDLVCANDTVVTHTALGAKAFIEYDLGASFNVTAGQFYYFAIHGEAGVGSLSFYYDSTASNTASLVDNSEAYTGELQDEISDYATAASTAHFLCYALYEGDENYWYNFIGKFDEDTGLLDDSPDVNVTAYWNDGTIQETFEVSDGNRTIGFVNQPYYFEFDVTYPYRKYFPSENEGLSSISAVYIFDSSDLKHFSFSFTDYAGLLEDDAILYAKRLINGTYHYVDSNIIDSNSFSRLSLLENRTYSLSIVSGDNSWDYGLFLTEEFDELNILFIRGTDIPLDDLLQYRYIRVYAVRDSYNNITTVYSNTLADTISVDIYIKFINGTVADSASYGAFNDITYKYTSANNNTDYYVAVDVVSSSLGTLDTIKKYLPANYTNTIDMGLDILGSTPIGVNNLLGLVIIVCAFALCSAITLAIGAVGGTAVASILHAIGFITIPEAGLAGAWVFSILIALLIARRHEGK